MSPCGVINRCAELFCSESKTQVYAVLHDLIGRNGRLFDNLSKCYKSYRRCTSTRLQTRSCLFVSNALSHFLKQTYICLAGYVIYDDGCHLRKFAQNRSRRDLTSAAKRLSEISIVVDKMHMKGHVDRWCKENCDARNIEELREVNIADKIRWLWQHSQCWYEGDDVTEEWRIPFLFVPSVWFIVWYLAGFFRFYGNFAHQWLNISRPRPSSLNPSQISVFWVFLIIRSWTQLPFIWVRIWPEDKNVTKMFDTTTYR